MDFWFIICIKKVQVINLVSVIYQSGLGEWGEEFFNFSNHSTEQAGFNWPFIKIPTNQKGIT